MTAAYRIAVQSLLDERNERGHWSGELSTSALSTATAVVALEMMRRNGGIPDGMESEPDYDTLIRRGLLWLAEYRNPDGGWGDTTKPPCSATRRFMPPAVNGNSEALWPMPRAGSKPAAVSVPC